MSKHRKGSIITKQGKLYARVQFVDELGKRRDFLKIASTKKEAKEKIKELLESTESKSSKELDASRMTFSQLADFYEDTYLHEAVYVYERKISGIRNIKPYKCSLEKLKTSFGFKLIQAIQYSDILKFKLRMLSIPLENGEQRSITGVNRHLQLLRRILNIAVRQGWLNKNPFLNGDSLISMADEKQRTRILSFAEESKMFSIINSNPQRYHLNGIVLIALDCGFRKKEILTLQRKDIDLVNKYITIRAFNSKTAKSRKVGMTTRVYDWLNQYENLNPEIRIFPFESFNTAWRKTLEEAEISDYHFHDNRHTCISRMVRAGLPHTEIMKISGHSTLSCLFRYINTDNETIYRIANVMDNFIINQNYQLASQSQSDLMN